MTDQVLQTITAVVVSIAFCLLYFAGSNFVLDKISTADVPLPAGGLLLVSALGAIGIRRARRKA